DLRPDELIQGAATGQSAAARVGIEAVVVEDRASGVAAQQLRAAQELGEQVRVTAEAAEEQPADRQRERPSEKVAPPVGRHAVELPRPEGGLQLEPRARSGERPYEPEQRVVVHQGDLGSVVADGST